MVGGVTVLVEPWPAYATLHLVLMAVDPGWRRRGVGASLVRTVQAAATTSGFDVWAAARTSALDFYTALGFRPAGDGFTGAMDLCHRRVVWRRLEGVRPA
jgi:GNAT superfamily N-acetyltransferase